MERVDFLEEAIPIGFSSVLKSARRIAFGSFVVLDLLTTIIALYFGYWESAPEAYLFGSNLAILATWLVFEKLVFFFGVEWLLVSVFRRHSEANRLFFYGGITVAGGLVTFVNLKWLWAGYNAGIVKIPFLP